MKPRQRTAAVPAAKPPPTDRGRLALPTERGRLARALLAGWKPALYHISPATLRGLPTRAPTNAYQP